MEQVECVVIGAGVVGLATARALALTGHEVLLLEKEADFGTGISSRNSEVIHAGIYYPAGSLKADLCVRGRDMLYAYCREHHVPHQRIGKLIVCGQDQDAAQLDLILEKRERITCMTLSACRQMTWWRLNQPLGPVPRSSAHRQALSTAMP
nr:FAD-dependent oxidoreductase [Kordiimonas gwangyangensis]